MSSEVLDGVLLLFLLPEGEVLLEELDDGLGVSEGLFIDVIDLLESIGEGGLTKLTGLLVVVHHFVMEHGEVESQSQSDWVAGVQTLGGGLSELVVLEGTVLHRFKLVGLGALGNVSVVVSNHFVEECLGLIGGGDLHALSLNNVDDGDALIVKLTLDLLLVGRETVVELLVLGVLLDGTNGSNGGSLGADLVLETNGKEVSLLSGEVLILGLNNLLKVEDHIVESLGLLGNSGHKNVFFQ